MLAKVYRIETDRLVIRCYRPTDASLLKASVEESLEHLLPWMPWAKQEPEPLEKKVERLRKYRGEFDLGIDHTFGIFNQEENLLIGSTGLHTRLDETAREIGYWIHGQHLRKGFAVETVQALLKVGFEIEQLKRIEIRCSPDNLASQGVPKKLGFLHEGTLKNRTTGVNGQPRDVMIWTLFREDYFQSDLMNFSLKAFDICGNQIHHNER
ncbi:MAG: GNAT family protein [Bacteroidota bacterium]